MRLSLFRDSQASFVRALETAAISYRIESISMRQDPTLTEVDFVATEALLDRLAETVVKWRREVRGRLDILSMDDGSVVEAKLLSERALLTLFRRVNKVSLIEIRREFQGS